MKLSANVTSGSCKKKNSTFFVFKQFDPKPKFYQWEGFGLFLTVHYTFLWILHRKNGLAC
jgi:hypothetical protein